MDFSFGISEVTGHATAARSQQGVVTPYQK
jgi:hypothetical protein